MFIRYIRKVSVVFISSLSSTLPTISYMLSLEKPAVIHVSFAIKIPYQDHWRGCLLTYLRDISSVFAWKFFEPIINFIGIGELKGNCRLKQNPSILVPVATCNGKEDLKPFRNFTCFRYFTWFILSRKNKGTEALNLYNNIMLHSKRCDQGQRPNHPYSHIDPWNKHKHESVNDVKTEKNNDIPIKLLNYQ